MSEYHLGRRMEIESRNFRPRGVFHRLLITPRAAIYRNILRCDALIDVMRPGSIVMLAIGVCLVPLHAQDCAPVARILPAGTLSGTLADGQCQLLDGTSYLPFRLDLPVRGQIKIALTGTTANFGLILRDAAGHRIDAGIAIARPIEAGSYTLLLNVAKPCPSRHSILETP